MAYGVVPTCKYGHGDLVLQHPAKAPNTLHSEPGSFFVGSIFANNIALGNGFSLDIWKCSQCSYLEFHDFEPSKQS